MSDMFDILKGMTKDNFGRAILLSVAASVGFIGYIIKKDIEKNEADATTIEKINETPKQTVCKLYDEYKKLTPEEQNQANLTYYTQLRKIYGDREKIHGSSATSREWLKERLELIHPDLTVTRIICAAGKGCYTSYYFYDFEQASYNAQKENPLFESKVDTITPSSLNVYHIIAAHAKNEIKSKDDLDRKINKLIKEKAHPMTYAPTIQSANSVNGLTRYIQLNNTKSIG